MNSKQTKKPAVKRMTIKLGELKGAKYTKEDLVSFLEKVPFKLININLSTKKSNVGVSGLGYTAVGYVNGFSVEEGTFDVVVFNNRVDAITKLGDVKIVVRAFTDADNKITKIISLDVEAE